MFERRPVLLVLALYGCTGAPSAPPVEASPGPIVVYSGRSEAMVGPILLRAEQELGLEIQVQYGDTSELVSRLLVEGAESPADVVFAQDPGFLGLLSKREALAPLSEATLALVDPRFRDDDGRWLGTSGRLRTLVIDPRQVPADQAPKRLQDLADPKWKGKLGWAPSNSSFQAHVSGLRHAWGEPETKAWLEGVLANEPTRYPKNSPIVEAANSGAIAIGWVNHYYLHNSPAADRHAVNWSFPEEGRDGNLLMVAGVGVRAGSARAADAERLVAWLVSEDIQRVFATENFEYPTRPGVPTHAEVTPLSASTGAGDPVPLATFSQEDLSDLAPTRTLLEGLGIL